MKPKAHSLGTRTLGKITAASGDSFVVDQKWNGALDGFITDLVHTDPHGQVTTFTLDADDARYRFVPLSIDEINRIIHVELPENRNMHFSYENVQKNETRHTITRLFLN